MFTYRTWIEHDHNIRYDPRRQQTPYFSTSVDNNKALCVCSVQKQMTATLPSCFPPIILVFIRLNNSLSQSCAYP